MPTPEPVKPEDELCDQLAARIEAAMKLRQATYVATAMTQSAREIAHRIMPIVLAYETKARADERAKVAEEMRSEAAAHRRSMEETTEIPQREVLMVRALALDTAASWLTRGEA